jgi:hypothetical protein
VHELGLAGPFGPDEYERLCLRVGAGGPTELDYEPLGGETRFRARASLVPEAKTSAGSVELTIFGDGRVLARTTLRRQDAPQPIAVDLRGVQRVTIRAGDAGDGIEGDSLCLAMPRFE